MLAIIGGTARGTLQTRERGLSTLLWRRSMFLPCKPDSPKTFYQDENAIGGKNEDGTCPPRPQGESLMPEAQLSGDIHKIGRTRCTFRVNKAGNRRTNHSRHHRIMPDHPMNHGDRKPKGEVNINSLFDANAPWVIVPNGSYKGFFDWVPMSYRVGQWSPLAGIVLTAFYAVAVYALVHWSGWEETNFTELQYPEYASVGWFYNLLGAVWMLYIIKTIVIDSPLGFYAWITYTVQSWTLLTIRHFLCAIAPWSQTALVWAERIRFPCALSPTITFFVWNFVLMPYAYFVAMKDNPRKQRNFLQFCTSFRLLNLHGLNIVLCVLNVGTFGSPPRKLEFADLFVALVSTLVYMTFYLLVLDRLGVHLYPVFSPRSSFLIFAWFGALACYLGTFHAWRRVLAP